MFKSQNGERYCRLAGSEKAINTVSFSPDGLSLAGTGWDGLIHVWNVESEEHVFQSQPFDTASILRGVCWQNSKILVAAWGNQLVAVDTETEAVRTSQLDQIDEVWCLFSIPGRDLVVVVGRLGKVQIYNSHSLKKVADVADHGSRAQACLSPSNELIASFGCDQNIRIYSVKKQKIIASYVVDGLGIGVTFLDEDNVLVGMGNQGSREWGQWNHRTNEYRKLPPGYPSVCLRTGNNGQNQFVVATGGDEGIASVWNTQGWSLKYLIDLRAEMAHDVIGREAVAARLIKDEELEEQSGIAPEVDLYRQTVHSRGTDVAWAPDGRLVAATVGNEVRVWRPGTGQLLHKFENTQLRLDAVKFTQDSSHVIAGGNDNTVRVWRLKSGRQVSAIVQPSPIRTIVLSQVGQSMATVAQSGDLVLWDIDDPSSISERSRLTLSEDSGWRFDFSNDNKYLAACGDGKESAAATIRRVDGLASPMRLPWDDVTCIRFNPVDSGVVFVCRRSGAGYALKWEASEIVSEFQINGTSEARVCSPGPFGRKLYTGHFNGKVRVSDVKFGVEVELRPMNHLFRVTGVDVAPTGRLVATIGGEGFVKLWDANTGQLIRVLE